MSDDKIPRIMYWLDLGTIPYLIEEVRVEHCTDRFVWVEGKRIKRIQEKAKYFYDWQTAFDVAMSHATLRLIDAKDRLAKTQWHYRVLKELGKQHRIGLGSQRQAVCALNDEQLVFLNKIITRPPEQQYRPSPWKRIFPDVVVAAVHNYAPRLYPIRVHDLCVRTAEELFKTPGVGKRTVLHTRNSLEAYGLSLGMVFPVDKFEIVDGELRRKE
jgi:hypothetical protein